MLARQPASLQRLVSRFKRGLEEVVEAGMVSVSHSPSVSVSVSLCSLLPRPRLGTD